MVSAARVIIIEKNKILLIHRKKPGKEYYVIPGGGIEKGESPEEAAIREIKEETNLDIELGPLLWNYDENVYGEARKGYYFLAKKVNGNLKLGNPELKKQHKNNLYILKWIPISELKNILLYPEEIKIRIIKNFINPNFYSYFGDVQ